MIFGNRELREAKRTRKTLHKTLRADIRANCYTLAERTQRLLDENEERIKELREPK